MGHPPARGGIPEIQRLYGLILHPAFLWGNQEGDRIASIAKVSYLSLDITKTRRLFGNCRGQTSVLILRFPS